MTQSIAVIDRGAGVALAPALPVAQMQARMTAIIEVMANVLIEGKDYGKIPGVDKPTLFKGGAEKLLITFLMAAAQPTVEDLATDDAVRYRVSAPIEASDGRVLAVGMGEASTDEEKYRWRRPVCDEEYEDTPPQLRREKWFRGERGGPAWKGKQIRTSPADLANTVLKMAHKRALIAGTLLATGASSVFNQGLEDLTTELRNALLEEDGTQAPAPSKTVRRASETKAAAAAGALVTDARRVKDLRTFGKDKAKPNYALLLEGDAAGLEYTTKDAALGAELGKFKGTDHRIRVTYEDNDWQGKVYHNIKSYAVDDTAAAPAPATNEPAIATSPAAGAASGAAGEFTAKQIPFGS